MSVPSAFESCLNEHKISYVTNARVCSTLLDGIAQVIIKPSLEQVPELLLRLAEEGLPYHVIGSGSNTLITGTLDSPLQTPIISTKHLRGIDRDGERITIGAGTPIAHASKFAGRQSLSGLEFARDIPGTTAGAIATDAWHPIHNYADKFRDKGLDHTDFNKHISSVLLHATVAQPDGQLLTMTPGQLGMGNRRSRLLESDNNLLLADATFGLEQNDYGAICGAMAAVCSGRKEMRSRNKCKNSHSVGRTLGFSFVPHHDSYNGKPAAKIIAETEALPEVIDAQGMQHSKRTPNIIANVKDGTAEGYLRIVYDIQKTVAEEHGTELLLEINIVR